MSRKLHILFSAAALQCAACMHCLHLFDCWQWSRFCTLGLGTLRFVVRACIASSACTVIQHVTIATLVLPAQIYRFLVENDEVAKLRERQALVDLEGFSLAHETSLEGVFGVRHSQG